MSSEPLSAAKQALLEQRLRGVLPGNGLEARIPRQARSAEGVLSPGQQRLWFLHRLAPNSRAYTMTRAWLLRGPLDPAALREALEQVIARHDVLRTTFAERDGRPVPVVSDAVAVDFEQVDLEDVPPLERDDRARGLVRTTVQRPFDLRTGPLIRASLLRLGGAEHVFAIGMHHIVCDEWSFDVLWRELSLAYADAHTTRTPALPPLTLQYADYALWQRARVRQSELQMEYWRKQLGGGAPPLPLPVDHERPVRQRFLGRLESETIPAAVAAALARFARDRSVTRFVVLLAAFKVLLHRYTGVNDIVVGTPVTGRTRPEFEGLIGFFLNSLVLRTDMSGDPTFGEVVSRVADTVLGALSNQDVAFETLVDELRPRRGPGQNPLFQVMFVLQQSAEPSRLAPRIETRSFPIDTGGAKFDLTLFATESPNGLELTVEYDADLFEASTARRILEHMHALLEDVARDPDRRSRDLPLLGEGELQLLAEWGASSWSDDAAAAESVLHLFRTHAERAPDATAITCGEVRLTYGELSRRARELAVELGRLGVGPDVPVGLCLERSPELLLGIFAVLEAGGAYVPLDPAYPAERLRFVLDDTKAPVVMSQRRLAPALPASGARVLFIDQPGPMPEGGALSAAGGGGPTLASNLSPDRVAYVIHTSGTSGRPRGVAVSHRNLAHSTRARLRYYADPPARFLLLSSFAFDSSVAGIFWTLCAGGTLVLPPPRIEQDIDALAELIRGQRVTHTLCLPSVYEALLQYAAPAALQTLQTVICAGEPLPARLVRRHRAVLPTAVLHNEYGPTEATVWCTVYRVPDDFSGARVPIGRPVPGARVHVLDEAGRPAPIGVPGELYVGGKGVALGYLGRDRETAECFVPGPADAAPDRLYRTGDRVRWRADGNLEFLGRIDQQVKVRGYRIEPAEIEAVLREHPAVRDCVVSASAEYGIGEGESGGEPDLVASLLGLDPDEAAQLLDEAEAASSQGAP